MDFSNINLRQQWFLTNALPVAVMSLALFVAGVKVGPLVYLAILIGVVCSGMAWLISSQQIRQLNDVRSALKVFEAGDLPNTVTVQGTNEISSLLNAFASLLKSLTQKRRTGAEVATERLLAALEICDTNVMVADDSMNIIYMNRTTTQMFKNVENDLRKDLPNFSADRLIGANPDIFHKNPRHQRGMIEALRSTYRTQITVGGRTFSLIATPIFSADSSRLGTVIEWKDRTDELRIENDERVKSEENVRVRQALDAVTNNVMIADHGNNIIYANNAWYDMMRAAEADVRRDLPHFNVRDVMGKNIDIFHKNPAHQRNLLERLTSTYKAQIVVGGRTFRLVANPMFGADQKRVGTVVEWADRTDEVAIEAEVDALVEAASRGDFTRVIETAGKQGFFKTLSDGLNRLMSTTEVGINDILRMLGAMARGDMTEKITRDYEGAFGQLKNDANATAEKLTDIISKIRQAAEMIRSGASEIAAGNADLSQRTEEQASSLEETAASMEEMTGTVKQSAENAKQANGLADEARKRAVSGGEVVERAVAAMSEINQASKRIADIIGVIDEIAFQTNLLALNAAVEAARAGEQGRGFAVVAGEVRNLAQRSAGAAKEIKELIRDSVSKVESGSHLVNESGATLREIVESVRRVSEMMREISDAAQEQTSGIEQVNTAVTQMDEMTQQNAALVEEATAAGETMASQANELAELIAYFKVDSRAHMQVVPASATRSKPAAAPARSRSNTAPATRNKPRNVPKAAGDEWEEF
jgi:methyl-accepting chemotaxis protein